MERKRVVATVAGSKSDDDQVKEGLSFLLGAQEACRINLLDFTDRLIPGIDKNDMCPKGHIVASAHRNPNAVNYIMGHIKMIAKENPDTDYFVIMTAGMLAVLPGTAAGYLYNELGVPHGNIFVIGVGLVYHPDEEREILNTSGRSAMELFEKMSPQMRNDMAAMLSLTQVPSCLAICEDDKGLLFDKDAFKRACKLAVHGQMPDELRKKIIAAPEKNKGKKPLIRPIESMIGVAAQS